MEQGFRQNELRNDDTPEKYRHEAAALHIGWRSLHEDGSPHDKSYQWMLQAESHTIDLLYIQLDKYKNTDGLTGFSTGFIEEKVPPVFY